MILEEEKLLIEAEKRIHEAMDYVWGESWRKLLEARRLIVNVLNDDIRKRRLLKDDYA